ncbi:methyltransferase [Streptomyces sp. SL13]|uniref:Ribosomal RNA large subunit methyltransferase G n=1 Tax=Streptantibioticus silvisoli TaxID=2705255 RepID=A0AA90H6X7_9ACTN|nr:methyltransferase [Streptantibioticus silvisoli]MDI5969082.1 methyltransferase [Streptantibioticus silvisoli]
MNRLTTPWRELDLARFPYDPRDQLRAWDAADEYLLRRLAGTDGEAAVELGGRIVVLGDRWGALSTALAEHRPTLVTDSWLARRATGDNLERNALDAGAVRVLTTQDPPPERIDVLLVRVPKSLALLEDQLHRLAPALRPGTVVLGTGMAKEIHTSTLKLFERLVGPTRTSLAWRKARLISAAPAPAATWTGANPWPLRWTLPADTGGPAGATVVNHAGVFCAERLDIGTRFFLRHLPRRDGPEHVVDLGCGNGVVGLAAALGNPQARLTFTDESFQALASAEATFRANAPAGARADFLAGDGPAGLAPGSADLVLNNPPFHSHQATTDATARRMFTGAREVLRPGGELWVVGNRHLGYHTLLRRVFGNCDLIAGDPKFVVLRCVRR